jgi:hypothetical protein
MSLAGRSASVRASKVGGVYLAGEVLDELIRFDESSGSEGIVALCDSLYGSIPLI